MSDTNPIEGEEPLKSFQNKPADLEAYLWFVQTIENNIERRYATNKFYLSAVSALIGACLIFSTEQAYTVLDEEIELLKVVALLVGFLSISWFFHILRFREISRNKYSTAIEMEGELQMNCLRREEDVMKRHSSIVEFTIIETLFPVVSGIASCYVFLVL